MLPTNRRPPAWQMLIGGVCMRKKAGASTVATAQSKLLESFLFRFCYRGRGGVQVAWAGVWEVSNSQYRLPQLGTCHKTGWMKVLFFSISCHLNWGWGDWQVFCVWEVGNSCLHSTRLDYSSFNGRALIPGFRDKVFWEELGPIW